MKNKLSLYRLPMAVNLVLFIPFIFFLTPVYNTNEDVYILYLLSGNFGDPPTEVLHYNHLMHPYLNIVIKNLFVFDPNRNWYSITLFLSHYLACCTILHQLLKKSSKKPESLLWYITLFIIFEGRMLLNINFTNTAIVLTCSASILLFTSNKTGVWNVKGTFWAIIFLVYASLFRIHVLIPMLGISLPFIFLQFSRIKLIAVTLALIFAGSLILLFNHLHKLYYKSAIIAWQQEESYRQKVYFFYNHHNLDTTTSGTKWETELGLINNGSPIDTNFLSSRNLVAMQKDLQGKKTIITAVSAAGKNWFWINNRLYFAIGILLIMLSMQSRELLLVSVISLVVTVCGFYILFFYAKLPEYLKIYSLFLLGLFIIFFSSEKRPSYKYAVVLNMSFFLLSVWGIIQLYKISRRNLEETTQFRLCAREVSSCREKLFVLTADIFPLQKFYVFDLPGKFALPNLIGSEHFLQNIYHPAFKRYGITHLKDLPKHSNVLFWGKRVPALETYFREVNGREVSVSDALKEFECGEVRSISFK